MSLAAPRAAGRRRLATALIDVRCMFVSVERAIDPTLVGEPVIVLSNNDGCAVSRSDEAKALGVAMGQPWFEIKSRPHLAPVIARSSNYEEYGAFSARFYETVASLVADLECYSVDEVFTSLPATEPGQASSYAAAVQQRVKTWTGLPTAAGIGPTKTLAKAAQHWAKAHGQTLVDITEWPHHEVEEMLAATPVDDVWGVGSRLTRALAGIGVHTALDLARTDPGVVRRRWSVVLERTVRELAGTQCIPITEEPEPRSRQQVMYSRMLGRPVTTREEVVAVLGQYATRAAQRLRRHGLQASLMQVWISSSRFRSVADGGQRHHAIGVALDPPTSDPLALIRATRGLLDRIEPGQPYNRAGILLTGLVPAGAQASLWQSDEPGAHGTAQRERLAEALDRVSQRFGREIIGFGPSGLRGPKPWDMRRDLLSPAATTRWSDLLTVR